MACVEVSDQREQLSAVEVDARLRRAIGELHNAERSVFLWFSEIERRRLYRELGYSSMQAYASEELGFTSNRICRYLHLMNDLERLPAIRAALFAGRLGWTKARVIVRVASAENEAAWLEAALRMSRRDLEGKIAAARAARVQAAGQPELVACRAPKRAEPQRVPVKSVPVFHPCSPELIDEGKSALTFRLTAMELAHYEALIERLHKQGRIKPGTPREEILLQALAAWTQADDAVPRGTGATSTHIHIQKDATSGKAVVQTLHGPKKLSRAELEAAECDAVVTEPGKCNRSTIPPSVRRAVLARDQHRCRAPGCQHTRFLEIHHITARSQGGTHDQGNLVTLCAACHRLVHERAVDGEWFRRPTHVCIGSGIRESGESV